MTDQDLTVPSGAATDGVPTDDPRVDAAIARLDDVHGRPAAEHVEVFEDVHRRLQEALTGLDGDS